MASPSVPNPAGTTDPLPTPTPTAQAAATTGEIIEPEHVAEDDSSFGEDDQNSAVNYGSVTSSIYDYRRENDRTYHAYEDGKYLIPNDEKEQARLDLVYHAFLLMFKGKSFHAPVKNPQRIVDMGTGTGIWALDVGDEYPEAQVIGIDLSPIQPPWVGPNVEFRVDDMTKPWAFEKPLDLVHSRICQGLAIRDWQQYLGEAFRCLRPGGWVEAQDFDVIPTSDDGTLKPDSLVMKFHEKLNEAIVLTGGNMHFSSAQLKEEFEKAGFVNVGVVDTKQPISPWPKDQRLKEAGAASMLSMVDDLEGIIMAPYTRLLGWAREEVELFAKEAIVEWKKKGVHGYWNTYAVYGQKPFDPKTNED